jgi:hypothetical protein
MSRAGLSRRNLRQEIVYNLVRSFFGLFVVAPILFVIADAADPTSGAMASVAVLAAGIATFACYAFLVFLDRPPVLRVSFAPRASPTDVRVVRWWRTRRVPLSGLSAVKIAEYRYRRSGETPAGDAQRETISSLPYRIDVVLYRAAGGWWTVRGKDRWTWKDSRGWKPDTRETYGPLASLLAPAGVTVDRQVIWTQRPVTRNQYFSPGSGGANFGGGC